MKRTSLYVPMRDGVRLAVDVCLPDAPAGPLPAVLHMTRYYRRIALRWPFSQMAGIAASVDKIADLRRRFVDEGGYAWLDVCVRGSGASFGTRPFPWSDDEVGDGVDLVDWIIAQPWSSGLVGATGISYSGTTAEHLLSNGHPAVRAIAPRFALFDVFTDVAFPGGVHLAWFTEEWGRFNRLLDANEAARAFSHLLSLSAKGWGEVDDGRKPPLLEGLGKGPVGHGLLRLILGALMRGVAPVDGPDGARLLGEAIADHGANYDVHAGALVAAHRDDVGLTPTRPDATMDDFSPHARADALSDTGAAIYSYSGWLDGAYNHAAVKRFRRIRTPGSRLILGPWEHGGFQHVSPFSPDHLPKHDHAGDLIAFFDQHLKPDAAPPAEEAAPVRYYTLGEERWKTAPTWPPPGVAARSFHLASGKGLRGAEPEADAGADTWRADTAFGTGGRSRWNALLGLLAPIGYGDVRAWSEGLAVYTSEPLPADLEVTGHPVARLWLSAPTEDLAVHAYLLDVHPSGRVDYVTEGLLRARHRATAEAPAHYVPGVPFRTFSREAARALVPDEPTELAFDLLPISWRFERGHRLRLAIAAADRDHFAALTMPGQQLTVHRGPSHPSRLELPIMEP